MTDLLFLALLVAVAGVATAGFLIQRERLANEACAWAHRARLARIVGEVERDPEVPQGVRTMLTMLGDNAFNDAAMRAILRQSEIPDSRGHGLVQRLNDEFGKEYGPKVHEAVRAYAYIAMYSDLRWGRMLRHLHRGTLRDMRNFRRTEMNAVLQQLRHGDDSGLWHGPQAA